jgi:hypothetical protein
MSSSFEFYEAILRNILEILPKLWILFTFLDRHLYSISYLMI